MLCVQAVGSELTLARKPWRQRGPFQPGRPEAALEDVLAPVVCWVPVKKKTCLLMTVNGKFLVYLWLITSTHTCPKAESWKSTVAARSYQSNCKFLPASEARCIEDAVQAGGCAAGGWLCCRLVDVLQAGAWIWRFLAGCRRSELHSLECFWSLKRSKSSLHNLFGKMWNDSCDDLYHLSPAGEVLWAAVNIYQHLSLQRPG